MGRQLDQLDGGNTGSDPTGFPFGSVGLANVSCGSRCAHQTGIAFDAGYQTAVGGTPVAASSRLSFGRPVARIPVAWSRLSMSAYSPTA